MAALGPATLWILCLAFLVLGCSLALWGYALQRQQVQDMAQHMDQLLTALPMYSPEKDGAAKTTGSDLSSGPLPAWLGSLISARQMFYLLAAVVLLTAFVAVLGGAIAGVLAGCIVMAIIAFILWIRWQRRHRLVLSQLPMFLDTMVRLIGLGNSMQAAFQQASASSKLPLRDIMERASSLTRAGMELEDALSLMSNQEDIEEFQLLAAVIRVSTRYGGRVDTLLERVAHFLRDKEQAQQELSAMSAETRMSAWILSLLPLVVGGMIIVFNGAYFMRMWTDPAGQQLILLAAVLQVVGVILLYRLARID